MIEVIETEETDVEEDLSLMTSALIVEKEATGMSLFLTCSIIERAHKNFL